LTQVLDRPVNGPVFFEEVIRENLGIGRQLIFDRRVSGMGAGAPSYCSDQQCGARDAEFA